MDSRKISELIRGGVLLATAVLLGMMLWKSHQVFPLIGISFKQVPYYPIAIIAAMCWVTYRGIRIIIIALRRTE